MSLLSNGNPNSQTAHKYWARPFDLFVWSVGHILQPGHRWTSVKSLCQNPDNYENVKCLVAQQPYWKNDTTSWLQHSFLPHISNQILHQITGTESVKYIVRGHNIPIEYAGRLQPPIHLLLREMKCRWEFPDTVCYKFESLFVHNCSLLRKVESFTLPCKFTKKYLLWTIHGKKYTISSYIFYPTAPVFYL